MVLKLEWWILILLSARALRADDRALCPCMPKHLCPKASTEDLEACDDLGSVHCCESQDEMHKIIGQQLTTDQQILSAIDSLIENMNGNIQISQTEDNHREEKSYSTNTNSKNQLYTDKKQFGIPSNIRDIIDVDQTVDMIENLNFDISQQNHSIPINQITNNATTSDKVFIVYAEKPTKNNAHFNTDNITPQIVLASQNPSTELDILKEKSNESIGQESMLIELSHATSTEQDGKLQVGKPNLNRPFPKRQSQLHSYLQKSKQKNIEIADSEVASTDIYKIREGGEMVEEGSGIKEVFPTRSPGISPIHVPNIPTEQISTNKLPFRSPPRRLLPRPGTVQSGENRQTSRNVLELLREQSKGRMGLKPTRIPGETIQDTSYIDPNKVAIMDTLNIRAINSIMKTNFSGHLDSRKPIPTLNSYKQNNTVIVSPLTDSNQKEQKTEQDTSNPDMEKNGNKLHQRGRFRLRTQPIKHFSTEVTMSQDDDSSSRLQDSLKRLQSRRRQRVKPQINTQEQGIETSTLQTESKNMNINEMISQDKLSSVKSISSFTSRRLRPRTKTNHRGFSPVTSNEESKLLQVTDTKLTSPSTTSENGDLKTVENVNTSPANRNEDLESSGTNEQFSIHGRFIAPERTESGFKPMLNGHNVQIIGPVPDGFSQSNYETNADEIGLEPPLPESQVHFNARSLFNSKSITEQFSLPPVFPAPEPPTVQSGITSDEPDLLPPLVAPTQPNSFLRKPTDFTKLHSELDLLKNRYETLLNRYAKALSEYNKNFKEFFN